MSEQQHIYPDAHQQYQGDNQNTNKDQVALEVANKVTPSSPISWSIPALLFGAPVSAAVALKYMIGDEVTRNAYIRVVKVFVDPDCGIGTTQGAVAQLCSISPGIVRGAVIFGAGLALSYVVPSVLQTRGFSLNVSLTLYSTQIDRIKHVSLKIVRTLAVANVVELVTMSEGDIHALCGSSRVIITCSVLWWIYECISYMSD